MKKIFLATTFIFLGLGLSKIMLVLSSTSSRDSLTLNDSSPTESFYQDVDTRIQPLPEKKKEAMNDKNNSIVRAKNLIKDKVTKQQIKDLVTCLKDNSCHSKEEKFHDPALSKEMRIVEKELVEIAGSSDLEDRASGYDDKFFKETFKINSTLAMLASTIIQIEKGESHEALLNEAKFLSGHRAKKFLDLMSKYESTHDLNRNSRNQLILNLVSKDNDTKLSIIDSFDNIPLNQTEAKELFSKVCPKDLTDEIDQIIKIKYNNLARRKGYDASCQ